MSFITFPDHDEIHSWLLSLVGGGNDSGSESVGIISPAQPTAVKTANTLKGESLYACASAKVY
jgi:hypothetical protein